LIVAGTNASASFTKATTLTLPDGSLIIIDATCTVSKKALTNRPPPAYTAIQSDGPDEEHIAVVATDEVSREGMTGLQRLVPVNP
jgi:hypothetical protein